MNTLECGKCESYDPCLGPGERHIGRGWCVPRSEYPHQEEAGQVFPPGVSRVAEGELAKPVLVEENEIVETCDQVRGPIDYDPAERKRELQTFRDEDGERILR